ncbi:MAG: phosphoribosyl-AMP cyclohydrolase, partial [Gaiellaceae bacterium]
MLLRAAIVQDAETDRVLMLAWMNDEAERLTRETGEAWFWSRSRERLWKKGETSGNTLAVEELRDDCDGDALLVRVRPNGPACHTNAVSCFAPWLWRVVAERAKERPEGSDVTALLDEGLAAGARKVGEEAVDASVAALAESDERLVEEIREDCDDDALLLRVTPAGPSCHTGSRSCFAPELWRTVVERVEE